MRSSELFAVADRVLGTEDIGPVHDMRVASRRLRAMLEIYAPCFPARNFDAVLTDVKALADALGSRRDPDVQLAALADFAAAAGPAEQPGLEAYRRRLAERQQEGNVVLEQALDRAREHDLRGRLDELVARAAGEAA